jgi:membrane-bound lytic murein transglycosylase B
MFKYIKLSLLLSSFIVASMSSAQTSMSFLEYADNLKREALEKGYDEAFLEPIFASLQERKAVVKADKNQPERRLTLDTYLETRVPDWKVTQAVEAYQKHKDVLARVSKQYGVQARFIVALWGNESNFGRIQGNHPVMSSLVSLAHEGRRETLFKNQFFAALDILREGHVSLESFNGSWAGAMGQSQFMPSSFLTYAVDANGDGKKDIWNTEEDVFASIANYLSKEGWDGDYTWGRQVKISDNFDMQSIAALEGLNRDKKKPLSDWQALGLTKFDGTALPNVDIQASLILPDGEKGRVYLVYNNFDTLMRWNRSYYFGISVAHLAERLDKALHSIGLAQER